LPSLASSITHIKPFLAKAFTFLPFKPVPQSLWMERLDCGWIGVSVLVEVRKLDETVVMFAPESSLTLAVFVVFLIFLPPDLLARLFSANNVYVSVEAEHSSSTESLLIDRVPSY
jgi:hypothetical protein